MNINLRKERNRGKTTWLLDYRLNGKRVRSRHATKALADAAMRDVARDVREIGELGMTMTNAERAEAGQIFAEAKKMGVTLRDVWTGYLAGGRDAVLKPVTLAEGIKLYIAAKRSAKRSERYVDNLDLYLTQFARGRGEMQSAEITHEDIEGWFNGRDDADETKASDRWRISGLFAYLVRRGYLRDNPCAALEKITVVRGAPVILTPDQCGKALAWALDKPLLPWLVLGLLCGLRPEEADQTTAKHFDKKNGWLTVDAQASKIRQRRVVHLHKQAIDWLKRCEPKHFGLTRVTRRRWQRKLRVELGLEKWPQDVLRHTFASFTMAEVQDAGRVAAEMGNSVSVLMRSYRELMTKQTAKQYRKTMALRSP